MTNVKTNRFEISSEIVEDAVGWEIFAYGPLWCIGIFCDEKNRICMAQMGKHTTGTICVKNL